MNATGVHAGSTTAAPTVTRRVADASWRLRSHLGPRGRSAARRMIDPILGARLGSVHHVATTRPLLALTLDDGPDPRWTAAVLDVLAERRCRVTFFMLVEAAEAEPELVTRVVAAGHEIGLHGVDHRALTAVSDDVEALLVDGRRRLEARCGRPIRWFRPPYGSQSPATYRATRRAGLDPAVWGPEGADWDVPDPVSIADRIASRSRAGDIVLLHDGLCPEPPPEHPIHGLDRAATVATTIAALADRGLTPTTLGELVSTGTVRRSVWFRPSPTDAPSS